MTKPVVVHSIGGPDNTVSLRQELTRPVSIATALKRYPVRTNLPFIAIIYDGKSEPVPVLRKDWKKRKVRRGETLAFIAVPGRGGGSGTGKQVAGIIATIALAVVAPGIGHAIAGAFQLGGAAAMAVTSLASAAFTPGGAILINAMAGHS